MTNKTINTVFVTVLILIVLLFSSCEKWRNNKETITTIDQEIAASTFTDMFGLMQRQVFDFGDSLSRSAGIPSNCYTVTKSGTTFPKTITLNFPVTNCTELYEISHSGVLAITFDKPFDQDTVNVSFVGTNFSIDNFSVTGTVVVTKYETDKYKLKVTNGVVTSNSTNEEVIWNSNYYLELADTSHPVFFFDDYYTISGTASGTNREGTTFTTTITKALQKQISCRWPESGELKIEFDELKERVVDFGSETCDNQATVEIGGKKAKEVTLK